MMLLIEAFIQCLERWMNVINLIDLLATLNVTMEALRNIEIQITQYVHDWNNGLITSTDNEVLVIRLSETI
ncbi:MAG: hypothetical protein H7329_13225 [Opitutaceae bacterium]|nr:hypothetical protein [Cytophagales bacterium]